MTSSAGTALVLWYNYILCWKSKCPWFEDNSHHETISKGKLKIEGVMRILRDHSINFLAFAESTCTGTYFWKTRCDISSTGSLWKCQVRWHVDITIDLTSTGRNHPKMTCWHYHWPDLHIRNPPKMTCWHYHWPDLVSSVGRAPICCAGGRAFKPQTGPTLSKRLRRMCCLCNYICKWLDIQVFSHKDYKL